MLSPVRREAGGVNALNARLQALLNAPHPGLGELPLLGPPGSSERSTVLRCGDRVIQVMPGAMQVVHPLSTVENG